MAKGADNLLSVCVAEIQRKKDHLGSVVGLKFKRNAKAASGKGHVAFFSKIISRLFQPVNIWMNQKDFFAHWWCWRH
jgi:hypothetical protein